MTEIISTKEFDKLLSENYIPSESKDNIIFESTTSGYVTESLDSDDLEFLDFLNELD